MKSWKLLLGMVLCVGIASVGLVACGGDDDSSRALGMINTCTGACNVATNVCGWQLVGMVSPTCDCACECRAWKNGQESLSQNCVNCLTPILNSCTNEGDFITCLGTP
jgi:hypothetical protein